ncbi:MAG: DUF4381 domain-containing protein [Gammaproteobacteria bacterium]|nr:MAG: DUF4381 domain-containing protein [Gammaproteobacteria bacterium]
MEQQQLALRDIHLPDPITWYPAPGWWLLLALLGILIIVIFLLRHQIAKKRREPKQIARRELEKLQIEYQQHRNPQILVQKISTLLRRVCLSYYPRTEVASLTGEAWLQFLDKQVGSQQFTQGQGCCLIEAPYRQNREINVDGLLILCQSVLNSFLKSGHKK